MKELDQNKILEQYVKVVRERRKHSNCYLTVNEVEQKAKDKLIFAYVLEETLLIMEKKRTLYYLYYISNSWNWIHLLDIIKDKYKRIVISIVQKQTTDLQTIFLKNGYQVYKTYQRLRCEEISVDLSNTEKADYCYEYDKKELRQMMDSTFDVMSDHIPTDEELEVFLTNRQIICVRNIERVIGFIIFEDKGKTSYIRMVCIDEKYRGKGFADDLMKMYFKLHENCTSFTLWYDMQNSRAGSLYKKWNYNEEDLYNLIYVV